MDFSTRQSGEFGAGFRFSDLFVWASRHSFSGGVFVHPATGGVVVRFANGAPCCVAGPGVHRDFLGQLLVAFGVCSVGAVERALESKAGSLIGERLMVQAGISQSTLATIVSRQVRRRVAELFGLSTGAWEVVPGLVADIARGGAPVDPRSVMIRGLKWHARDTELEDAAEALSAHAVRLCCSIDDARALGSHSEDEKIIELLRVPRHLEEIETYIGNRRQVRAVLRALALFHLIQVVPKDLVIPLAVLDDEGAGFEALAPSAAIPDERAAARRASSTSGVIVPPPPVGEEEEDAAEMTMPVAVPRVKSGVMEVAHESAGEDKAVKRMRSDVPAYMWPVANELEALHPELATMSASALLDVDAGADAETIASAHEKRCRKFNPARLALALPDDLIDMARDVEVALNQAVKDLTTAEPEPMELEIEVEEAPVEAPPDPKIERAAKAATRFKMGEILLKNRDYANARAHLQVASELDPLKGEYRALYGWAIYSDPKKRRSGLDEAFELIWEAALIETSDPMIQCYLGQVLVARGQINDARGAFEKAIAIDPLHEAARRELHRLQA